ncbi:hypothetical protein PIB30_114477, partial [Stylosanthes scabra]|nr:hypothetical protein [Stylosanthes scabra]
LEKLTLITTTFVQSTNNFMEETRANFRNQEAAVRNLETQVGQTTNNFMEETRAIFKNQESAIRNLETQVGQIARQLSTTLPNAFPSDTQVNPRGECKAVTLRSGSTLEEDNIRELHKQKDEEDSKEKSTKG